MSYQESISINEEEMKELISEDQAKEFAVKELNDKFNKQPGNITKTYPGNIHVVAIKKI